MCGEKVRALRKAAGMSASRLAGLANVSIPTLRAIESGRGNASGVETVTKITDALGVRLDDVLASTSDWSAS